MTVTIVGDKIESFTSSVGFYIFNYAKDTQAQRSMDWLCSMCDFYKRLNSIEINSNITSNIEVEVSETIVNIFPKLIQKHIFNEIDETGDCDIEWLCLMTDIYQQMLDLQHQDKRMVSQEKKIKADDVEADGQEVKNITQSVTPNSTVEVQTEFTIPSTVDEKLYNESEFDDSDYACLEQEEEELY